MKEGENMSTIAVDLHITDAEWEGYACSLGEYPSD